MAESMTLQAMSKLRNHSMSKIHNISLFLVMALACEARPLIDKYKLRAITEKPFRQFAKDNIHLIISGIGKTNAAAATAVLLHGRQNLNNAICLNLGIAGHANLALGSVFIAHAIIDKASNKHWNTAVPNNINCPISSLISVDSPTSEYPNNTGLDMEASAFYPTAIRYAGTQLTHIIKIVSDTPQRTIENLNKQRITQLLGDAQPEVDKVFEKLRALAECK